MHLGEGVFGGRVDDGGPVRGVGSGGRVPAREGETPFGESAELSDSAVGSVAAYDAGADQLPGDADLEPGR